MEYFLLKPFEEGYRIKIKNHDRDILICTMAKKGEEPDFTLSPCPLISDRFKELLARYLPNMDFIPCVTEGKEKPDFWAFHPENQAVENARFRPALSVRYGPWDSCRFLRFLIIKRSYIINPALVESLLRRGYVNLGLERIETLGGRIYE